MMRYQPRRVVGTMAVLAFTSASGGALAADGTYETKHHQVQVETVVQGLEHPWALAFLPDGHFLVTERNPGQLRIGTRTASCPTRSKECLRSSATRARPSAARAACSMSLFRGQPARLSELGEAVRARRRNRGHAWAPGGGRAGRDDYSGAPIGVGTAREGMTSAVHHFEETVAPSGLAFYVASSSRNGRATC